MRSMHRKILWALTITAVAPLVGACATPTPETIIEQVVVTEIVEVPGETTFVEVTATPRGKCSPTDVAGLEVLKIGVPVPLSAPGSVIEGRAMQTAINIAVDDINTGGGVLGLPVDVVFYDTSALPERGTAAMEYFATQECVVAVVGEYHSAAGVAMKEISNKYHIPTILQTWDDSITGVGYSEVFRVAPTSSIVADADANFIESLGAEFVVIMTESTDYGIPAAEATTAKLNARGIGSETYQADPGTQDFSSVIASIQEGPVPDVVLVLVTGETSYNFEQQAAEAGLMPTADTVCIAYEAAAKSTDYWTNVPDGNYCTFRQVGLVPALANDLTKAFEAEYRKHFDTFPESYALEAYDSLRIMADAINRAGSIDADAIISALEATDIQGTLGRLYFPYGADNPVPSEMPDYMWHQWPDPAVLFLQYFEDGQSRDDAAVVYPEIYWTHGGFIPFGETP